MFEIRRTDDYAYWFKKLRDRHARARILARIRRLSLGSPGDSSPIREGVSEMRIDYGPGYRVYYKKQTKTLAVLLAGGDKRPRRETSRGRRNSLEGSRRQ